MDQWERFDAGAERHLEELGFVQTLEVYEPAESYTPGDGYTLTYPSTPTDTVDAEVTTPEAVAERTRGGLDTDADVLIYVPDDTGLAFTGYGDSGDAAAKVVDISTGETYRIETRVSEHNGLLRLEASEVDD